MLSLLVMSVFAIGQIGVNYEQGYKRYEDGDALIIYIGASWCPPCRRMHKEVLPKLDNVVIFDYDKDREESLKFMQGGSVPQIIRFQKGQTTKRWVGFTSETVINQ